MSLQKNATKFAMFYDDVIKYNFCLEKFPQYISHINVTEAKLNLSEYKFQDRVEHYLHELYIPTSLVPKMVKHNFEFNESSCLKLSCNPFYPLGKLCNENEQPKLVHTGTTKVLSCQPGCKDSLPDLYWNRETNKCMLANTLRRAFANDPSLRAPTYTPGLSNTPTLNYEDDEISFTQ